MFSYYKEQVTVETMYIGNGEIPKKTQTSNIQKYITSHEETIWMGSFLPLILVPRFSLEEQILPSHPSVTVLKFRSLQSDFYGIGKVLTSVLEIKKQRQVTSLVSETSYLSGILAPQVYSLVFAL